MRRRPGLRSWAAAARRGLHAAVGSLALVSALESTAQAGPLARVELLGDASPPWLIDQLPLIGARPGLTALAALAQVEPTFGPQARPWTFSAAISGQSAQWEPLLLSPPAAGPRLRVVAGAHARGLLPVGAHAGLLLEGGGWTAGLTLRVSAASTWAQPDWSTWRMSPGLSVGWAPRSRRPPRPAALTFAPAPQDDRLQGLSRSPP
ncbi:MAG: hypothetical protein JNM72_07735 [Deltaproteobacteria bacterium]|nr:hypothetical protein [Deltaproteobacteria bacterium]